VIAWKLLAAGAIGPYTQFRWPVPSGGAPGEWVHAPAGPPERGVHACRPADLPYWFQPELWRVELDGPLLEAPYQVIAPRGRLLERVAAWDAAAARALAEACAWRTRERVMAALRRAGFAEDAGRLASCADLPALGAAGAALAPRGGLAARLGGYLGDAAALAGKGSAGGAAFVAAHVAQVAEGSSAAFAEERSLQARWLAERLRL